MKSSLRSILCHSLWILGHNLKLKWYVSFSRNLFVKQMIYCSLNGTVVFLIFLSEAINMPCFTFISRMHDLQWGKLSRSHGSYGIRQDLSALGSSDPTSAQIRARKVKYHQPCYQWLFSQASYLLPDKLKWTFSWYNVFWKVLGKGIYDEVCECCVHFQFLAD